MLGIRKSLHEREFDAIPLTPLFNPFRDLVNHSKNSWEGAAGKSSTLPPEEGTIGLEVVDCATGRKAGLGRVAVGEAATADGRGLEVTTALVLPLAPTVTHALPLLAVAEEPACHLD